MSTVNGSQTITGSLTVNGAGTIGGNATVNGTLTTGGNATMNKDLRVKGWLYAANVRDMYKGTFSSLTALTTKYPAASCQEGWIAGVETNSGVIAYVCRLVNNVLTWQTTNSPLQIETDEQIAALSNQMEDISSSLSGKVDKVSGATAGRLALLTAAGGIQQGGLPNGHSHGNIGNDGTVDSNNAVRTGDALVVAENGKTIIGRSAAFDISDVAYKEFALTKYGTFEKFLTSHQSLSGYQPTISDLATIRSRANNGNTAYGWGNHATVGYSTQANVISKLGRTVGEAVRVVFNAPSAGEYTVIQDIRNLLMIACKGVGYVDTNTINLEAGANVVSFVFADPATIPAKVFLNVGNIKRLHIPSFVHAIGALAFGGTTLGDIDCEAMTPPTIDATTFGGLSLTDIKVHDVVKGKYTAAAEWSNYASVITTY